MTTPPRDPEQVLRQAFEAHTEQVDVAPDALVSIRSRIAARRARRKRTFAMSLAGVSTGLAASVTAIVLTVGSCAPQHPSPLPGITTGSPTTVGPTPSGTPTTAPTTPAVTATLPVYFRGMVSGRAVLYREYQPLAAGDGSVPDRIAAAVDASIGGHAADPDYGSDWLPYPTVGSVTIAGTIATVDLIDPDGPNGTTVPAPLLPGSQAQIMIQQLVYTVTAVASDAGGHVTGVRLLFAGQPRDTYRQTPVAGTLTRASAADVQAPVWLRSPQEGEHVGPTFTVEIDGIVPEATARLRVRDANGNQVSDQQVMLNTQASIVGVGTTSLTLPPGQYTIEAYYVSLKDGTEQALDDHRITVD
jgi:hypothetical protein